jgi:hypothetical protein
MKKKMRKNEKSEHIEMKMRNNGEEAEAQQSAGASLAAKRAKSEESSHVKTKKTKMKEYLESVKKLYIEKKIKRKLMRRGEISAAAGGMWRRSAGRINMQRIAAAVAARQLA